METIRRRRMVASFYLLVAAFGLVLWQLYQIQISRGATYALQANRVRSDEVVLEAYTRGEITDRNRVPLTGGYYANRVVVFPRLMTDKEVTLRALGAIIDVSAETLESEAQGGAFYLARNLTAQQYAELKTADMAGVYLLPVYLRYGDNPLAAHITGHLGKIAGQNQFKQLQAKSGKTYRIGDWVGQSGLEYFYEAELKGEYPARWARLALDARGRVIKGSGLTVETAAFDYGRHDVVTTIDRDIQQIVEVTMDQHIEQGAVVVMRAGSGDIVAMSSRPAYHPDPSMMPVNLSKQSGDFFVDRCTALFQPGSVFKVVLAAAAIEENLVDRNTSFLCGGQNSKPIRCWHDGGHGKLTFHQAFAESCNPAFVELGQQLGSDRITRYAAMLGLDNQTIAGYPVKQDQRQELQLIGQAYNLANSSVGQGPVLVTPVQVTAMINTIASGGVYYQPRLVDSVRDHSGNPVRVVTSAAPRRVIQSHTAHQLQLLLREVTLSGVGTEADLPVWGSAGKTGSAQVGADKDTVDAWFAGYFPADDPRYVITVLVHDGKSGGATAAPLFKEIAHLIAQVKTLDAANRELS